MPALRETLIALAHVRAISGWRDGLHGLRPASGRAARRARAWLRARRSLGCRGHAARPGTRCGSPARPGRGTAAPCEHRHRAGRGVEVDRVVLAEAAPGLGARGLQAHRVLQRRSATRRLPAASSIAARSKCGSTDSGLMSPARSAAARARRDVALVEQRQRLVALLVGAPRLRDRDRRQDGQRQHGQRRRAARARAAGRRAPAPPRRRPPPAAAVRQAATARAPRPSRRQNSPVIATAGTNQVQSSAECTPKTTATSASASKPGALRRPRLREAAARQPKRRAGREQPADQREQARRRARSGRGRPASGGCSRVRGGPGSARRGTAAAPARTSPRPPRRLRARPRRQSPAPSRSCARCRPRSGGRDRSAESAAKWSGRPSGPTRCRRSRDR